MANSVALWSQDSSVSVIRFEQLLGDGGVEVQAEAFQAVLTAAGLPERVDIEHLIENVIGTETLTYSGSRTEFRHSWNEEVETTFETLGLGNLNRALGYPDWDGL